jgi:hypothetical protein
MERRASERRGDGRKHYRGRSGRHSRR